MSLPACKSVPQSVKDADKKSLELDVATVSNTETILQRTLKAYSEEAFAHIEFRAKIALMQGKSEEDVAKFIKESREKVLAIVNNVVSKYAEVKKDWKASVELRVKISEFLENKQGTKDIIDRIIKELDHE